MKKAGRMREHVLLLNLTRLGDMLQSQPLIQDLHDSGHKVSLVCLENFAPALALMRHVEHACVLPGARLLADTRSNWRSAAARLLVLARDIREKTRADRVVNLTPTLPARLLAKLLAPSPAAILGFGMDEEGFGVNGGAWASFLSGASGRRVNTPFNVADMFRRMGSAVCSPEIARRAGVSSLKKPSGAAFAAAEDLLRQIEKKADDTAARPQGYVGFQLGASEARRQWPVEYFADLGDRLWKAAGLCPVILGTEAERNLAGAYGARAASPFVNAVGRTDIPELAALLSRMRLLVTNDTGTMHLAAGLGVPSLAFFLATAQPWDTGPCLTGCCCLEPALSCHPCAYGGNRRCGQACLTRISPRAAESMILGYLRGGSWSEPGPAVREQARVWLTAVDEHGFAALRCLSGHDAEDRGRWLAQQRLVWRQILDDMDGRNEPDPGPGVNNLLPPLSPAFRGEVVSVLARAVRMLALLTEQGKLAGQSVMAGQLFLRNCDRLQQILDACRPLASLGHFWRELVRDRGGNMEETLRLTSLLAGHLARWETAQK
ncbi:MAG: glycosyltransferase family 9 protein [Desulfovibrio sp.]|jgi:ADP-heptose:LPS heptosyltransferase|nr:glycosyltransferase family 9 protein [Desulfovibrio sp.]